jgi:hypothetical protein
MRLLMISIRIFTLLVLLSSGLALGQTQPTAEPPKQDTNPCVGKEAAQEVLRLGRSLGYPDDKIVQAYGENPCATLSQFRRDAPLKGQPTNLPDFRTPAESTQEIEVLKGKAWLSFDPNKWKEEKSEERGRYGFQHVSGDGYAMVISERIQIPTDKLREIAISNAREAAIDIKVVEEQRRRVNGSDLLMLRLEGHIKEIPFTYLGYYCGGPAGTIQVITYTGQNLFNEYRQDFENFLNGLRVSNENSPEQSTSKTP